LVSNEPGSHPPSLRDGPFRSEREDTKGFYIRYALSITAVLAEPRLNAQNLTLEGQTGGFITPTAYVVYSAKGHFFSYPAVGYHFVNASKVIGDIHTFRIEEGFGNRAELGYRRSGHQEGNSPLFSQLWHFAGMNVFNGKEVAIRDGQLAPVVPGLAAGFVVRTGDKFVTGALDQSFTGALKSYTNEDVYVAVTKTWLLPLFPFLANPGAGRRPTLRSTASAARPLASAGVSSAALAFQSLAGSGQPLCLLQDSPRSHPRRRTWALFCFRPAAGRTCPPRSTMRFALRRRRIRTLPSTPELGRLRA
jgi:hypothetical protein